MANGFYAGYFTGAGGQGQAMFVLKDGVLVGADAGGVCFDGSYSVADSGEMKGVVSVKVPPGTLTVQGVAAGSQGLAYEIPVTLPSDFSTQPFIRIDSPFGAVNVRLVKIREFA